MGNILVINHCGNYYWYFNGKLRGDSLESLVRFLAEGHDCNYEVRTINAEWAMDDPAVPDSVSDFVNKCYRTTAYTEYEFNSMWTFSDKV